MNQLKINKLFNEVKQIASDVFYNDDISVNHKMFSLHVLREKSKILPIKEYLISQNIIEIYMTRLTELN